MSSITLVAYNNLAVTAAVARPFTRGDDHLLIAHRRDIPSSKHTGNPGLGLAVNLDLAHLIHLQRVHRERRVG